MPTMPLGEGLPLSTATELLYTTFASYPRRPVLWSRAQGRSPEEYERLQGTPLRELTPQDLSSFLTNTAALMGGKAQDLKSALPRLCELSADYRAGTPQGLDPLLLGVALRLHGYERWPHPEQQAIQLFCHAWWRAVLTLLPPSPYVIADDWAEGALCTIGQFTEDLEPYLATWRRMQTLSALVHFLVWFGEALANETEPRKSGWWQRRAHQWHQVRTWVLAEPTRRWVLNRWEQVGEIQREDWLMDDVVSWLTRQTQGNASGGSAS